MANILAYLQAINSAVYGKDVRSSIHDAINAMNTELESSINRLDSDYSRIESDAATIIDSMQDVIESLGRPVPVEREIDMENRQTLYVYVGSEPNMNYGHWYYFYWTQNKWVDGGVYNSSVESYLISGSGENSVIENDIDNNQASGDYSYAGGKGTVAAGDYQHVFGTYNEPAVGHYTEIVGNGTSDENRSNARTLDENGNEWLAGRLEFGPNRDYIDGAKIAAFDIMSEYLRLISDTTTITQRTQRLAITDAARGMPLNSLPMTFLPVLNTEETDYEPYTDTTLTIIGEQEEEFTIDFTKKVDNGFYAGTFDPVSGTLTVTMIGSTSTWGDMQFSIDPDNFIGKRIPLPQCLSGFDGDGDNTFCNVSDVYDYSQTASRHHYVYKDEVEAGYAVVVLPDDTPSDTIVTVVGTLETPLVYQFDPIRMVLSSNSVEIVARKGFIEGASYYSDLLYQKKMEVIELMESQEMETLLNLVNSPGMESLMDLINDHNMTEITSAEIDAICV